MPQVTTFNSSGTYTISTRVHSLFISMYGGSGGGEYIEPTNFVSTAGGSGTATTFLGLSAGGGQGGGVGAKNGGGTGGTASQIYDWTSQGATIVSYNGSNGVISSGGAGGFPAGSASFARNGGSGTLGATSYTSFVYHEFDNTTDQHIVTSSSSDISVGYESPGAADGLSCAADSYSKKHYSITFIQPFADNSYTISISGLCQQAAAGGPGNMTYAGELNKTSSGFRAFFCRDGNNSYIRCFTINSSGVKAGASGVGGGGAAALTASISRSQLIASQTYAPNTTQTVTIGSAGAAGNVLSATAGTSGYVEISAIIIPEVILSLAQPAIVKGASTTLSWSTTGDADTISFNNPSVTNLNLNSEQVVSPTTTTTYTATVSGLGGTDTDSITLIVYQPPTVSVSAPTSIDYGTQTTIEYSATYANVSVTATPEYKYDNTGWTTGTAISLNISGSAEENNPNATVTGSFTTSIPYNDYGPREVKYTITAVGSGGAQSANDTITINIDETPSNVIIPDTDGKYKNEDPVYTPDTLVTTETILVQDIDIPVEIKSNKPIKVKINDGNWNDLRQI